MPDIADGRSDFREATRRAEEAAGIFRDDLGNEVYADRETPEVPELEGAVPVAASDQPLPEDVVLPEPEPVTPEPEPQPQSLEELQAEVARLHDQLATKESFIGRQTTDVGELRAEVDALRAQITAPQPPAPAPAPQVVITQELINEDPARATQLAFEQGNEQALGIAFESWKSEDEFTAGQWLTDRRLERQSNEFNAKLAEVRGEVEQVRAPQVANAAQDAWGSALLEVQKSYPDFLEKDAEGVTNAQRLLEEFAPQFPAITAMMAAGDVAAKVQGLTLLYEKGRLGNPARMQEELQSAADEAAASAAAARAAAAGVNGQSAAGQGSTVELTEEQEEAQKYLTRMTSRASLTRGWTGRGNA